MENYDEHGFSQWYGYVRVNVYKAALRVKLGDIPALGKKYVETVLKVKVPETNPKFVPYPVHIYEKDTYKFVTMMTPTQFGFGEVRGLKAGDYLVVHEDGSKSVTISNDSDVEVTIP